MKSSRRLSERLLNQAERKLRCAGLLRNCRGRCNCNHIEYLTFLHLSGRLGRLGVRINAVCLPLLDLFSTALREASVKELADCHTGRIDDGAKDGMTKIPQQQFVRVFGESRPDQIRSETHSGSFVNPVCDFVKCYTVAVAKHKRRRDRLHLRLPFQNPQDGPSVVPAECLVKSNLSLRLKNQLWIKRLTIEGDAERGIVD